MNLKAIFIGLTIRISIIRANFQSDFSEHCRDYTGDGCRPTESEINGTIGTLANTLQFLQNTAPLSKRKQILLIAIPQYARVLNKGKWPNKIKIHFN